MWRLALAHAADPDFEGCWTNGKHTETWAAGAGIQVGAAVGGSEAKPFWEQLRLERRDGVWTYVAWPKGQAETAFPLVDAGASRWTFELPEHDFPQRIRYDRGAVELRIRVEDLAGEGFGLALRPCGLPSGRPPALPPLPCDRPDKKLSKALERAARYEPDDHWRQADPPRRVGRHLAYQAIARTALETRRVCTVDDAVAVARLLHLAPETLGPEDHRSAWALQGHACAEGRQHGCAGSAASWDRYLVGLGRPQWFGTQWDQKPDDTGMCVEPVDPEATDADRAAAGQPPLSAFVARAAEVFALPADSSWETLQRAGRVCALR